MNFIIRLSIAFLFFLLLSCNNSNKTVDSQPQNDSIKKYLELASNDTLPFPERSKYNKKAFSFLDTTKNDTLTRWYLSEISYNYMIIRNWKNFLNSSKIHYELSSEKNDTLNLARFYRFKSTYFSLNNNIDSAYYCCFKAEKFYKKINDYLGLGIILYYKGILQNDANEYLGAQLTYTKAINILKKTENRRYLFLAKSSLAGTYAESGENDNAIKLYESILEDIKNEEFRGVLKMRANVLNNLGDTYGRMMLFDKEKLCYEKALKDRKLVNASPMLHSLLSINLANNKINQKDYNNIENSLLKILRKENEINDNNISFRVRLILSKFYLKINRFSESKKYAEEALKLSRSSNITYDILNSLVQVASSNKEKAQKCIIEYDKKIDSLISAERKTRNQFYKIQLDVDQINEEKEIAIKQKWTAIAIIASVLLIVILLFIIYKQKAKQKELKLLQEQQKANEDIYQLMLNQQSKEEEATQNEKKRIALELHDNIMNKLAATRFNLFAISQKTDKETIDKAVLHVAKIKDIEDEIRAITHSLSNESLLETQNFGTLIEKLIEEQNAIQSTKYRLEIEETINWELIASKVKMNLYRILQEAIHNINKHAEATTASISIILDERNICMAVQDNGKGFDDATVHDGIGLKNMRQRIKEVNGKITIQSTPNQGTNIFLAIPF